MKILMLFVDMLRPNRFGLYNQNLEFNEIDKIINTLGGTIYTNCFSPAPDTPRGMACFYSGLSPIDNGCDTRVKWPSKFLNKETSTIFDHFLKENYKTDFFSNPNERKGGLFPPRISDLEIHNNNLNLEDFINKISLQDNHLLFVSIPDYHWALQDWGYSKKGEKVALNETSKSLDIVLNQFDKDEFDHIFLFSDHGFKFTGENKYEEWYDFLNRDRTNIFLFHRHKGDQEISYNNKLCSIQDISNTIDEIFLQENELSLFSKKERDYVVIEDHVSFEAPKVNQDVDMWAVITKNEMYFRSLENAATVRDDAVYSDVAASYYDEILKKESQFGRYYDEYKKVFEYHKFILAQTTFMNGNTRPHNNWKQNILIWIEACKDRIKYFFFNKFNL